MEEILFEALSWKTVLRQSKKVKYNLKTLDNSFANIKVYKTLFETLFFEELRSQFDRIVEINLNKEKILTGYIINQIMRNKKFYINIFLTKGHIDDINKDGLVFIITKKIFQEKTKIKKCFGIIKKKLNKDKTILLEINYLNWKNFNQKKQYIQFIVFGQTSGFAGITKEFDVINSVEDIKPSLLKIILLPRPIFGKERKNRMYNKDKIHLLKHFNKSQTSAINAFLYSDITLIQGPPGTGKTRTILGIISLIKIIQKNSNLSIISVEKFPQTIIVCAPSNAAIDENVMRATNGFMSILKLHQRLPIKMVRLGPNYHSMLDHISLENYTITISSDLDQKIRLNPLNISFKKIRRKILKNCPLIFTTLACTGYAIMKTRKKSETIILDEAGQAIELSTLIPIKKSCKKIILIGDIQQLPATVFSRFSTYFEYNRSLFKRFQIGKFKVRFLENQYRMHPQISSFPARKFYRNYLKDARMISEFKNFQMLRCFGPLVFFNVCEGEEQPHYVNSSSWCNLDELKVLSFIFKCLICLYPISNIGSIGIIGGYNGQIDEIKNHKIFKDKYDDIQVNTIDGYQGREKDVICFTCVRAKNEKGVGFLTDGRRINVGFTRAKNGFWIFGNSNLLSSDLKWNEVTKDIKKRSRMITFRKPTERSIRKMIYWSSFDNNDYSDDGETILNCNQKLLYYLKNLHKKETLKSI